MIITPHDMGFGPETWLDVAARIEAVLGAHPVSLVAILYRPIPPAVEPARTDEFDRPAFDAAVGSLRQAEESGTARWSDFASVVRSLGFRPTAS